MRVCPSGLRCATGLLADGLTGLYLSTTPNAGEVSEEIRSSSKALGPPAFRVVAVRCTATLIRMSEVTRLLDAAAAGDRKAAADLLPLVYDELRQLAAARMATENPDHTLNPTALVHEAYLRLVDDQQFDGRGHFFAAAAEAMRRVLVDHARNRNRLKRGGPRQRVDLNQLTDLAAASDDDLLGLDDALEGLAKEYPAAAELVKLRFFVGMTLAEAAEALGLSDRTADRYWVFARPWLANALTRE